LIATLIQEHIVQCLITFIVFLYQAVSRNKQFISSRDSHSSTVCETVYRRSYSTCSMSTSALLLPF